MTISGLVLAGGQGSRLGGVDKALVELDGRSLAQRAIERLRPQVRAVAISAGGDRARFGEGGLPVLPDLTPGFRGPLAGILSGLAWTEAEGRDDRMASVAVDTPFFPADLVARLDKAARASPGHVAVARSHGRLHPVFALWPLLCRAALDRFLAEGSSGKVMTFLESQGYVAVDFADAPPAGDPFFNINRPEDLASARALAGRQRP